MTFIPENSESKGRFLSRPIIATIIVGMLLRLVMGLLFSFPDDTQSWALTISNFEASGSLYELAGYYYMPIWGYILGTIDVLGESFGVDQFGTRLIELLPLENGESVAYTLIPSVKFSLMFKIGLFICDLAVSYLVWYIVMDRTGDSRKSTIAFILSFLCPLVITACTSQGMFDTIGALLTLLCVVLMMKEHYFLAGSMFAFATVIKVFPGFLIFLLAAYVLSKHRADKTGVRNLMKAVIGATISFAIIIMPQVMEGTLEDCFSFLLSRTDTMGGSFGKVISVATIVLYIAIVAVSILIGRWMYKSDTDDRNGLLLSLLMVNITIIFLFPANAQYLVLLVPFLIIQFVTVSARYKVPMTILMISTAIFAMSSGPLNLVSFAEFTGLLDVNSVVSGVQWYIEPLIGPVSLETIVTCAGVIEYISLVLILKKFYDVRKDNGGHTPTINM